MNISYRKIIAFIVACGLFPVLVARRRCAPVVLSFGKAEMKSRGRIMQFQCYRGYTLLGEPYAACLRGKWDPDPPVCIKPGCTAIRNLKNGHIVESKRGAMLEFSCNPGYKIVGPTFIYCNGRKWNNMQPYCRAADVTCNFEMGNACSWTIENHDDDEFTWHLQQTESPNRILGSGPKSAHSATSEDTGRYLLVETGEHDASTQDLPLPARIRSPRFPPPNDNKSCFIFWYHMFGSTVGMLNVFLNNSLVFQEKENHGDRWIKGVITLPQNATELQLIIEATHGMGNSGDIALDDFSIGTGAQCQFTKVSSCNGRCGSDWSETDSCLCNPECFVDSSCCEDYSHYCSNDMSTSSSLEPEINSSDDENYEFTETSETIPFTDMDSTVFSSASPPRIFRPTMSITPSDYVTSPHDLPKYTQLITTESKRTDGKTTFLPSTFHEEKSMPLVTHIPSTTLQSANFPSTTVFSSRITLKTTRFKTSTINLSTTNSISTNASKLVSSNPTTLSSMYEPQKNNTLTLISTLHAGTTNKTLVETSPTTSNIMSSTPKILLNPTTIRRKLTNSPTTLSHRSSQFSTKPSPTTTQKTKLVLTTTTPQTFTSTPKVINQISTKNVTAIAKMFPTKLPKYSTPFAPSKFLRTKAFPVISSTITKLKSPTPTVYFTKASITKVYPLTKKYKTKTSTPLSSTIIENKPTFNVSLVFPTSTVMTSAYSTSLQVHRRENISETNEHLHLNTSVSSKEDNIPMFSAFHGWILLGGIAIICVTSVVVISCYFSKSRKLRHRNGSEGDVLYVSSEEMFDFNLARPVMRAR